MIYINKIFFINKKNFIWYMKDNTHSQFFYQQCIYLPFWYKRFKIPALLKYYTGKAKNEEKKKHKNRNTDHVGASKNFMWSSVYEILFEILGESEVLACLIFCIS